MCKNEMFHPTGILQQQSKFFSEYISNSNDDTITGDDTVRKFDSKEDIINAFNALALHRIKPCLLVPHPHAPGDLLLLNVVTYDNATASKDYLIAMGNPYFFDKNCIFNIDPRIFLTSKKIKQAISVNQETATNSCTGPPSLTDLKDSLTIDNFLD